jgi:hypothetical protein
MISNFVSRFSSLSPSRSRSSSISTSSSSGRNSQLQTTNANNVACSINASNRSKSSCSKTACPSSSNSSGSSSSSTSNSNRIKKRELRKKNQVVQKLTEQKLNLQDEYQKAVLQTNFLASLNYFENLKLKEQQQKSPEHENATAQSLYHTNNNNNNSATSPTVLPSSSKTFFINKPVAFEKQTEVINNFTHARPPHAPQAAPVPIARFADEPEYRMNHAKRGYALIINNKVFDDKLEMGKREGTDRDAACLESTLIKLGFDIKLFHNLTAASMRDIVHKFAKIDHTNHDMFMCCMMSHGDNNIIYGTDQEIEIDQLMHPFKYNPTLAGKPKIFFIQACRGTTLMEGIDSNPFDIQYCSKIPLEADFLIGYSTIAGYYSWRNSANGSWFIQSLCNVLNENGRKLEIMQLLTAVNRRVAYYFESNTNEPSMHGKKQIPCIVSMLTKELYFKPKYSYLPGSNNY